MVNTYSDFLERLFFLSSSTAIIIIIIMYVYEDPQKWPFSKNNWATNVE